MAWYKSPNPLGTATILKMNRPPPLACKIPAGGAVGHEPRRCVRSRIERRCKKDVPLGNEGSEDDLPIPRNRHQTPESVGKGRLASLQLDGNASQAMPGAAYHDPNNGVT